MYRASDGMCKDIKLKWDAILEDDIDGDNVNGVNGVKYDKFTKLYDNFVDTDDDGDNVYFGFIVVDGLVSKWLKINVVNMKEDSDW